MSDKCSFVLYFDIREPLDLLTDSDRGRLFLAVLDYAETGKIPECNGALQMAFAFIRKSIDRNAVKWEETCRKRAEAGRLGGTARAENQRQTNQANATFANQSNQEQANQADNVPVPVPDNVSVHVPVSDSIEAKGADKPPITHRKARRFTPPSYAEVVAYCIERKNSVDPQRFIDHYETNGWVQGKGKPIQDWKAAVRTWEGSKIQLKEQQNRRKTFAELAAEMEENHDAQ